MAPTFWARPQRMTARIRSRNFRFVAMYLAGRAKGLGLHKGAVLNAGQRIIMELLAFRAETASEGVMLLAAVERDHLADQQFFIVSLFWQGLSGWSLTFFSS